MWKTVILSALLVVVQGASLDEIYGSYFPVMFFPRSTYVPYCVKCNFLKDPRNVQCTCADGKTTPLVGITVMEASNQDGPTRMLQPPSSDPLLVVDTVEEVNPSLNVSCNCAGKEFRTRIVLKKVNENYIIIYNVDYGVSYYNDIEKNTAHLLAMKLPKVTELTKDLSTIEELKNRRGAVLCTQEVIDQFKVRN